MTAPDGFYLAKETHRNVKGELVETKDVLCYRQARSGYDGKATWDHVKSYPGLYEEFRKANPDYKLPVSWSDVNLGAPILTEQPAPAVKEKVAPAKFGKNPE